MVQLPSVPATQPALLTLAGKPAAPYTSAAVLDRNHCYAVCLATCGEELDVIAVSWQ